MLANNVVIVDIDLAGLLPNFVVFAVLGHGKNQEFLPTFRSDSVVEG